MNETSPNKGSEPATLPTASLMKEVSLVFAIQLALVVGLVQLDKIFGLGGNLYILVAVVFILLPVLVMDKRDKPYKRYGIAWGKPGKDIVWTLAAMAILFPFVVLATHAGFAILGPEIWGMKTVGTWEFAWPKYYPTQAISHFVVTALPEEFFYRGYLMGRLDDIFKKRVNILGAKVGMGLLLSSLAFGLAHYLVDLDPGRLMVFFSALAFGWLRAKRGTILAPILFHAASNIFMEIFRAGYGL